LALWLAPVAAHQLRLRQDVVLEGALQFLLGSAGFEVHFGVERVELKEVAMRLARRRAGTAVADAPKVVATLPA